MSRPRSTGRAAHTLRAWKDDLSFQLVVVPGVLALISLLVGDVWNSPGWAAVTTAVAVAAAFGWYWWAFARRVRRSRDLELGRGDEVIGKASSLVTTLSRSDVTDWHPLLFLVARLQPSHVGLLVSDDASQPLGVVQRRLEAQGVVVHVVRLDESHLTEVVHLRSRAGEVIDRVLRATDDGAAGMVCDITGGTSVASIGLYEAAMAADATVTYIMTPGPNPSPAHENRQIIEIRRPLTASLDDD